MYRVVHKFCNTLKCEYLPMNRRQIDKIYMECVEYLWLWHITVSLKFVTMRRDCGH